MNSCALGCPAPSATSFFRPTNRPMPLSTWTTRSPILRSRKSEMNVRAADLRRSWTRRSSSKRSVSANSRRRADGQVKAARQLPGRDEHRRASIEVVRGRDRSRADLVVGEQLDRPLGAAGRRGDEDDGLVRARAPARISCDPVADAAVILQRRQRRHVPASVACALVDRELADLARRGEPRLELAPGQRDRLVRRHVAAALRHLARRWRATAPPAPGRARRRRRSRRPSTSRAGARARSRRSWPSIERPGRRRAGSGSSSRCGLIASWSSAASDRCVAASYRRTDSTMSPMNSRRTGWASAAG